MRRSAPHWCAAGDQMYTRSQRLHEWKDCCVRQHVCQITSASDSGMRRSAPHRSEADNQICTAEWCKIGATVVSDNFSVRQKWHQLGFCLTVECGTRQRTWQSAGNHICTGRTDGCATKGRQVSQPMCLPDNECIRQVCVRIRNVTLGSTLSCSSQSDVHS